jgi:hypothetical protein
MSVAAAAVIAALGAALATGAEAQPSDYAALAALPRWEGSWNLGDAARRGAPFALGPLRPEMQRLLAQALADELDADPMRFCRPPDFTGFSGGVVDNIEFLFTPGRVTLLNESGLIRRIYTDGRALPEGVEPSKTGTSVGRWEGETLVVETIGLDPDSALISPAPAVRIGRDARITERISLLDAQRLQFEVTIVAPELFTEPAQRRVVYTRAHASYVPREVVFCTDRDRSIDPITGKQRFDMTPPADLPPPPLQP